MRILDLTAGKRAIWYDKNHPLCTYLDIRKEMDPDVVCDTKEIPHFVGENFDLVVYDPPHMNCGPNSNMAKRYGHWKTEEILSNIRGTQAEAYRVTNENALMAFKWNNHDIKLEKVLKLMPYWEPLFGHMTKNGPHSQTFWVMLRRISKP